MPELPNIQAEIIRYAIEQIEDGENVVHLRPFCEQRGYGERRVARKVLETGVFDWGVSPMGVWPREDVQALRERLDEWPETEVEIQ